MLTSPKSLDEEHEELMSSIRECSKRKGETGKTVSQLLEVLEPHFEKEQKVVVPLLGSISELVSGEKIANLNEIASAQAPLLKEYEGMFEEHKTVRELISKAEKAARKEGNEDVVELLKGLAHHARIEEEVLYPSALLAGTLAKCLQPQERIGGRIA
jgi:hemerythrin